jgi:hypothetical protein
MMMAPLVVQATATDVVTGPFGAFAVYAFHLLLPLAVAVVATVRHVLARRRARLADAQFSSGAALEPGPLVLSGPVTYAPGLEMAMRVAIEQVGTEERTKNGWRHTWSEIDRDVAVAPFYVADRRGRRVRVEPTPDTLLIDEADRTVRTGDTSRTRIAELTAGEDVFVIGELVRARDPDAGSYRGAETALVMRPAPGRRMLISSEPLGDRLRAASRGQRTAAIVFAAHALVFSVADLGFYARTFMGRPELAEITAFELTTGKGATCDVAARLPDGESFRESVTTGACASLAAARERGQSAVMPVIRVPSTRRFAQIGVLVGAPFVSVSFGIVTFVLGLAIYLSRDKRWYESKLVESSAGPLPPFEPPLTNT